MKFILENNLTVRFVRVGEVCYSFFPLLLYLMQQILLLINFKWLSIMKLKFFEPWWKEEIDVTTSKLYA